MFARKDMFSSIGRAGAVATVLAVALTAVQPSSMAFAGSATSSKGVTASTGTSDATDITAARRPITAADRPTTAAPPRITGRAVITAVAPTIAAGKRDG